MSFPALPEGRRRRAPGRPAGVAVSLLALLLAAGCASDQRCSTNAECETGQVCSNEKNPRGDGVCIDPCSRHPNTPPCIDAAAPIDAAPAIDAGIDAPAVTGGTP